MALIGEIISRLGVNSAAFGRGLNKSAGMVQGFVDKLGGMGTALVAVGAAVTSALAVDKFKDWTMEGLGTVDALNDMAQKVGTTVEALGALQFAAQMSGSNAEELNAALEKMVLNLGKAETGKGVAKTLDELGLGLHYVKSLSADQAFATIIDGLSRIQNPAEQTAAAVEIFGKKGATMLQIIRGGKGNLDAMIQQFKDLGLEISGVDAAKVAEANDKLDTMSAILTSLKNKLAVELAPVISAAVDKFIEWGTKGGGIGSQLIGVAEKIVKAFAKVQDVFDGLALAAQAVLLGWEHPDVQKAFMARSASEEAQKFFDDLKKDMADISTAAISTGNSIEDALDNAFDPGKAYEFALTIKDINKDIEDAAKKQAKAFEDLQSKADRIYAETRTPEEQFQTKIKELEDLHELFWASGGMMGIDPETFARAAEQAKTALADSIKAPDLEAPNKEGKIGFAGALDFNSAAARSVLLNNPLANKDGVEKEQLAVQKKIRDNTARQPFTINVLAFA